MVWSGQEGGPRGVICIQMADSLPCAAETQHYKAITFQFKKSVKERSEIKTVVSFYSVSIFLVRTEIYVNILTMKHEL